VIANLGQHDVVGSNESAAHDIDQVSSQQVLGQKQFILSALKAPKVHSATLEPSGSINERHDFSGRNKEVSPANAYDKTDHGRMRVVAQADHEVFDPPDAVPGVIDQRTPDDS